MIPLLSQIEIAALVPSLVMGAALGMLAWWVLASLEPEELAQQDQWRYDISRINELRRLDVVYRMFHPVIAWLARLNRGIFHGLLPEIQREIQAAGLPRFWLAEEYLARMQVIGVLLLPFYLVVCIRYMGIDGAITAVVLSAATVWLLRRRLTRMARRRLVLIKRRMPFLLDLLTLLMEAGSSFLQALKQAVSEFEGHPVATEFNRVLLDMNMGKARTEAFDNMRRRLADDEIGSIVGAIMQSEELGTPLSHIFRTQSDVLQIKRTQRAETIAGEAGVNMLLPGMLVMAATVLIILGPFLLNYLNFQWGI